MEISVRHLDKIQSLETDSWGIDFNSLQSDKLYVLEIGRCGIELSFEEACAIRRLLSGILKDEPYFNNHPDDAEMKVPTYVYVEESDQGPDICFGVAHCFWQLDQDESETLLEALDAALMSSE